jgi:hypothetical protein
MKTYVKYPPRKLQSEVYTGPITITDYQQFKFIREALEKEGVHIPLSRQLTVWHGPETRGLPRHAAAREFRIEPGGPCSALK